jgi:hypothetical protein
VATLVQTPNIHIVLFDKTKQYIEKHFEVFREQFDATSPTKILLGAELRIGAVLKQMAE